MVSSLSRLRDMIENTVADFCRTDIRWFALSLLSQDWLKFVKSVDYSQQWIVIHIFDGYNLSQVSIAQDFDTNGDPHDTGYTAWIVDKYGKSEIFSGISREDMVAFVGKRISDSTE